MAQEKATALREQGRRDAMAVAGDTWERGSARADERGKEVRAADEAQPDWLAGAIEGLAAVRAREGELRSTDDRAHARAKRVARLLWRSGAQWTPETAQTVAEKLADDPAKVEALGAIASAMGRVWEDLLEEAERRTERAAGGMPGTGTEREELVAAGAAWKNAWGAGLPHAYSALGRLQAEGGARARGDLEALARDADPLREGKRQIEDAACRAVVSCQPDPGETQWRTLDWKGGEGGRAMDAMHQAIEHGRLDAGRSGAGSTIERWSDVPTGGGGTIPTEVHEVRRSMLVGMARGLTGVEAKSRRSTADQHAIHQIRNGVERGMQEMLAAMGHEEAVRVDRVTGGNVLHRTAREVRRKMDGTALDQGHWMLANLLPDAPRRKALGAKDDAGQTPGDVVAERIAGRHRRWAPQQGQER